MTETILATKLYVPPPQPGAIRRPRLTDRLTAGLHRKLTLISAPAGFGKTTAASEWVAGCERPVAWLSLDERDSDSTRFLAYLVAALHTIAPHVGAGIPDALESPQPPSIESVLTTLLNDIVTVPDNVVLVLDDYHVVHATPVDDALTFLLEHLPPQLHLVIATREDPHLPLARLRVRGQLTELRASDLRFTPSEAAEFLNQSMGLNLSEHDIAALETRTEGWIAGLQLAAVSMRGIDDTAGFITSFTGSHRFVLDYLVEEVLQQQSDHVQAFLLHTSIFDRLCGSLCDAVMLDSTTSGRDTLEYLEHINLFIVPLDNERRWYRYHHLFADVLRRKPQQAFPQVVPELRRRASVWFEEHDDPVEAIWQAIHGEDWQRVDGLIQKYERLLSNQGRSKTLLQLTQAVPNEVVLSRPWLLITRAWAVMWNGAPDKSWQDLTALVALMARIEGDPARSSETSEQRWRDLHSSLAQARALNAILENDFVAALAFGDDALRLLPEEDIARRSVTGIVRAQALWLSGDLHGSATALQEPVELSRLSDTANAHLIALLGIASIDAEWGHLDRAAQVYTQAIAYAEEHRLSNWQFVGRILSFQSEVPYEQNNLSEALEIATRGRELAGHWVLVQAYDVTYLHLARIHYAHGDPDRARYVLSQAPPVANVGPGMGHVAHVAAFLARIELESGEQRQLAAIEGDLLTPVASLLDHIWLWTPAIRTRGQVLNLLGRHAEAVALLAPLFAICVERGWIRQAVQTGAVLAISYHRTDHRSDAISTLERVLAHAEPHGFLRSILDAGTDIDQVLEATLIPRREEHLDTVYLNRLIKIARGERHVPSGKARAPQPGLIEPLSERELEVLRLIAAGYPNAEIAGELYVVVGTVKAHAYNIYSKLGVRNRTQAVARARELGLVD